MMKNTLFVAVFSMLAVTTSNAQTLKNIYGSGAVLRQNSVITLAGWHSPAQPVSVVASWAPTDTLRVQTPASGRFEIDLKTPAGSFTKHTITVNGVPMMEDVLVGEVWLCSGQSNMQWSVNNGIADGERHASEAVNDNLRIFQLPLSSADSPQLECRASWSPTNPATMRNTSAIGYFFARRMIQKLNLPVGIVVSAWGGTAAESWTPTERTMNNSELRENLFIDTLSVWRDDRPGVLYNSMIAPLAPYNFSGVLWYQGETNVPKFRTYEKLLTTMIWSWRDHFKNDTLPFYIAQIAPYRYNDPAQGSTEAAMLREAQEMVTRNVPNATLIVLSDLTDNPADIHPRNKLAAGERFADEALTNTYGLSGFATGFPRASSAVRSKNGDITLTFKELTGDLKLVSINGAATLKNAAGLTVIDAKGNIHPATGRPDGRKMIVRAPKGVVAVEVRYCFDDATIGNLASGVGLPVAPFRAKL